MMFDVQVVVCSFTVVHSFTKFTKTSPLGSFVSVRANDRGLIESGGLSGQFRKKKLS